MNKPTYPLAIAQRRAGELRELMSKTCHQVEIAGSVRREARVVHDIDLVAWPMRSDTEALNLFGEVARIVGGPDRLVLALRGAMIDLPAAKPETRILRFSYRGLPVEVYLAENDGLNFGALWQMRTGSAQLNTRLAAHARSLGLYYKAGHGIYQTNPGSPVLGQRVDDGTEAGIFAALELVYLPPALRADSARLVALQPAREREP